MKCFCEIDYNLFTSIIALFVASLAVIVSYFAVRYQIISLINSQLSEKAKECNSNLNPLNLSNAPRNDDKVSGFLSSIITAEELLNYQVYKRNFFLCNLNVQYLIDHFYLQLHTTIRVFLEKNKIDIQDLETTNHLNDFQYKFERAKIFLKFSIQKNKKKEFELLHELTIKRNNKIEKNNNNF